MSSANIKPATYARARAIPLVTSAGSRRNKDRQKLAEGWAFSKQYASGRSSGGAPVNSGWGPVLRGGSSRGGNAYVPCEGPTTCTSIPGRTSFSFASRDVPRHPADLQDSQEEPPLVSIMKRPSTTPGLSPSMRAAIAFSAGRQSRRHVKVKTSDGKALRTRDSSGESSRESSPEPDQSQGSRLRSRATRSVPNGFGRRRSSLEEGRPYSGSSSWSGSTRPLTTPAKPVNYKLSTIKKKILACRTFIAMGKDSRKNIRQSNDKHIIKSDGLERNHSSGKSNARPKVVSTRNDDNDNSDVPQNFVFGTESYYEVINRLCRPTVASVARASMKLIRASGPTLDEPPVSQSLKRELPSQLTEEYLSRRFLGEQHLTPEEVEEIVLRLCQPTTDRVKAQVESRLPLRKIPRTDRFGIVQSYMWTCGEKMEQNQWERKTLELKKKNFQDEKIHLERKLATLAQSCSVDVTTFQLPHARPLVAPYGINMGAVPTVGMPLYNAV